MAGLQTSIQLQDKMSAVLNRITGSMNMMLHVFETAQSSMDSAVNTAAWDATRQSVMDASTAMTAYREELARAAAIKPPEPTMPTWQNTAAPQVFMSSGTERFAAEFQAADQAAQKLYQTQQAITAQARKMDLAPPGMINDISEIENRIQTLVGRIQQINQMPVDLRTERINGELESLRGKLGQAVESQNNLNQAMSRMDISTANAAYQRLNSIIGSTEASIRDNISAQEQFNSSMQSGVGAASKLESTIKRYAAAGLSLMTGGKILGLADDVSQTATRLDLVNQKFGESVNLQQMVYDSSMRSRGSYLDTANAVARLGNTASNAFNNTGELVAFAEQLNKQFVLSGASTQEMQASTLQLTQALASGVLRGDELNSVFEQAPMIIQSIADYMEVPIGSIRELASDGVITSEIIKNAMFAATEETEARFAQMPLTFGQVANSIKNQALMAFQPALQQLSSVTQSEGFNTLMSGIISGIQILASAAVQALELMGQAALFVQENLWWLLPAIGGVTTAVLAYKGALVAFNIVRGINKGLEMASVAITAVHTAATFKGAEAYIAKATSCSAATATQWAFNASLFACPLTWIVLAIMAVVAAIVMWINRVGGIRIAWAICVDAIKTKIEQFHIFFANAVMNVQNATDNMAYGFEIARVGIVRSLGMLKAQGLMIIQNFLNGAIEMINKLINSVNSITGLSLQTITWTADFGSKAVEEEAAKQQESAANLAARREQNDTNKEMRQQRIDNLERHAAAAQMQRRADLAKVKNDAANKAAANAAASVPSYGASSDFGGGLGDIAGNTGNTAGNTARMADSMDMAEEELKSMRDMAEQEIINRFTTAELTVNMGGITNQVNSQMDLDGIGQYLDDVIFETLEIAAEGVHG